MFTADGLKFSQEEVISKLKDLNASYIIIGKEKAPTTGWIHWQGYVQFSKKITFTKCQKKLTPWNLSIPEKGVSVCIDYCRKEGDFVEFGEARGITLGEKNKTRWKELYEHAKNNRFDKIEEEHTSALIIHRRALMDIRDSNIKAEHHPERQCIWIWGYSGVGKTRWVHENFPNIFTMTDTDGWDQYAQERSVLLDEADAQLSVNWKRLLRWADRYPVQARRLYGTVALNYSYLIVTSMKNPSEIFQDKTTFSAIERRFIIVRAMRYDCERNDLIIQDDSPFPLYLRNYLFKFNIIF